MKFLVDRDARDTLLLRKICLDTLCLELVQKTESDLFCGFYIDGRNREINSVEDEAAFRSFKAFSKYNYPYF